MFGKIRVEINSIKSILREYAITLTHIRQYLERLEERKPVFLSEKNGFLMVKRNWTGECTPGEQCMIGVLHKVKGGFFLEVEKYDAGGVFTLSVPIDMEVDEYRRVTFKRNPHDREKEFTETLLVKEKVK